MKAYWTIRLLKFRPSRPVFDPCSGLRIEPWAGHRAQRQKTSQPLLAFDCGYTGARAALFEDAQRPI